MDVFDAAAARILALEGVRAEPKKTMVSFYAKRAFAFLSAGPRKGETLLTLALRRRVEEPPVWQVVEPYPGRFTHHIPLRKIEDLDARVDALLVEAYRTAGQGRGLDDGREKN